MFRYALFWSMAMKNAFSADAGVPPLAEMYDGFQLPDCVRSSVWSNDPLCTPIGRLAKVGVCVATPAVPEPTAGVGAWMCDAVVLPVSPAKVACTRMVCRTLS